MLFCLIQTTVLVKIIQSLLCHSTFLCVAVLGQDFTAPSPLEVTFSSGDMMGDTSCATFGIVNDDNLEFDHEFTVSLDMITPTGPMISMPTSTTVSISDDEGIH